MSAIARRVMKVAVVSTVALGLGATAASAESYSTFQSNCNSAARKKGYIGCDFAHVNIAGSPNCTLGYAIDTSPRVFIRSWGCPGSPYYIV